MKELTSHDLWLNNSRLSVLCLGQNNSMKSQPFTVPTKTKWISFLKAALPSASSASSSRSFPHQISPSRALATVWQLAQAWPPRCCSPSLWPPCLQTQSKTESLEERVQSCPRPLCSHHQNPLRKPKDRSQGHLAGFPSNWERPQIISLWWHRARPVGWSVLQLSQGRVTVWLLEEGSALWWLCSLLKADPHCLACFFLKHWLKQERSHSLLLEGRYHIIFLFSNQTSLKKQTNKQLIPANIIPEGRHEWCCKNHLLYENDYFIMPVLHFLKRSKQDVQRFFGGLLFLVSLSRCVLFSAVSSFGTKGIVDIFPAILISWLCFSPKQELIGKCIEQIYNKR